MRFILLVIFLPLLFSSCFKKQVREVYPDGRIQQVYFVNDAGKKNGQYQSFYENGIERSEGQYLDGKQVGIWWQWHQSGKPLSEGQYDDSGLQTGEWHFYYPDGNLQSVQNYLKGRTNGESKEYYKNRNIKSVVNMVNGAADGIEKRYYENGALQAETPWTKGSVDGLFKEYAMNNKVHTCGIRHDSGPLGFICDLDTLTGDTLRKAYIRWGKLSDSVYNYKNNKLDHLEVAN